MVAICISNGLVSRRGAKIGLCLIKHDNAINRLLQKIVGCSMPQRHMSDIIRDQQPVVLSPETSIRDACRQMQKRRIGAILVAHSDGHLVGIFTGRDAVCRVLAEGLDAASTKLADVMTKNPDTITPEKTAMDALLQMATATYRSSRTGGSQESSPAETFGVPRKLVSMRRPDSPRRCGSSVPATPRKLIPRKTWRTSAGISKGHAKRRGKS